MDKGSGLAERLMRFRLPGAEELFRLTEVRVSAFNASSPLLSPLWILMVL